VTTLYHNTKRVRRTPPGVGHRIFAGFENEFKVKFPLRMVSPSSVMEAQYLPRSLRVKHAMLTLAVHYFAQTASCLDVDANVVVSNTNLHIVHV
jgi:hypothetical protein